MKSSQPLIASALVAALSFLHSSHAFSTNGVASRSQNSQQSKTAIFDGNGTGGWGIGGQREITPEEFARGDRRYFDGYKMNEQGDFMMQIEEEKEALEKDAMSELLGVAKFAGLNVKDPSKRLNKFDAGFMDDDDDDLDLSV
mmetsp:Transcript_14646/g.30348  ORF Transcript_14646/g.30348 Transcript_14646/m.30348 type:complete len:142 (+) Transcript_14646:86-511(+)|eukprot:CAMPEP_0201127240 /NCGR_PEP_ID=MMETSP0850-20130426/29481_1 /ASSEMBLY_ACC=CAM_ASM_000622 /TAXON_ID=183588 /ORGANISM="Pseudo-nitzschia fraudulenta, Strain WWA7" /LENGTH=141 /DNA_ID=CAMNT_0047396027 /DNA_START=84 /DNA_END=509 /DNA_ORIENTATION=+